MVALATCNLDARVESTTARSGATTTGQAQLWPLGGLLIQWTGRDIEQADTCTPISTLLTCSVLSRSLEAIHGHIIQENEWGG